MVVAVICVGNEWQLDDGFGPAVAAYLQERYEFPDQVQVLDRAVMGYAMVEDLRASEYAIVVDALDGTGAKPGTLFSFKPQDMAVCTGGMSLHDVRFADVLATAQLMGAACAGGQCFGVQVQDRGDGTLARGLSEPVAAAVAPCARAVVRYLEQHCAAVTVDRWRASKDPRAVLEDPAAYVRAATLSLGMPERAGEILEKLGCGAESQDPVYDFAADELIASVLASTEE